MLGNEADLAARTVAQQAPGRRRAVPGLPLPVRADRHRRRGRARRPGDDRQLADGPARWATSASTRRAGLPLRLHRLPGAVRRPQRAAGRRRAARGTAAAVLAGRAAHGDPAAVRAVDTAAWALGVALAGVLNVLDIPTVVLGGHLGELGDLLCPRVEEHLARRVLSARWRRPAITAGRHRAGRGRHRRGAARPGRRPRRPRPLARLAGRTGRRATLLRGRPARAGRRPPSGSACGSCRCASGPARSGRPPSG